MMLVVMLLASGPDQPEGDIADRLDLHVQLTGNAHIDEIAYHQDPEPWPTRRILPDGRVYAGELIRLEEGWAIRRSGSEDDPLWPFQAAILRPGEYVTVLPPNGSELVYRVVSVDQEPSALPAA